MAFFDAQFFQSLVGQAHEFPLWMRILAWPVLVVVAVLAKPRNRG